MPCVTCCDFIFGIYSKDLLMFNDQSTSSFLEHVIVLYMIISQKTCLSVDILICCHEFQKFLQAHKSGHRCLILLDILKHQRSTTWFLYILFHFFETEFHCVTLPSMELPIKTMLDLTMICLHQLST